MVSKSTPTAEDPLPFPTRRRGADAPRPELSPEQRRMMLEMLGINPDGVPGTYSQDGRVLIVIPGFARAPATGTECRWTGLSYEVFQQIRLRGVFAADGTRLMPPFQGWTSLSEAEGAGGRRVIHFDVAEALQYMRRWCEVTAARREEREKLKAES